MVKESYTALATSTLPQYSQSMAFMERFLVAAHMDGAPIERSPTNKGVKLVDGRELDADALNYFVQNKEAFGLEFTEELRARISDEEFYVFCEVVAHDWFDGKRLRQNGRSQRLKRSICDYLCKVAKKPIPLDQLVQTKELPMDVEPLITVEAVAAILTVNDQMIFRHIEEWKSKHPNSCSLSNGDIFLRRGLALEGKLDTSAQYKEWDFINSYSIAFSAPEKFSQMMSGKIPAIVNGELSLFENRILFFSPFIPGMNVGQLEFGIIPSEKAYPIAYQGVHGGISEYIIDPAPFQMAFCS